MAQMRLGTFETEMICAALGQHLFRLTHPHQRLMCRQLHDWLRAASKVTLDVPVEPAEYTADDGTSYSTK